MPHCPPSVPYFAKGMGPRKDSSRSGRVPSFKSLAEQRTTSTENYETYDAYRLDYGKLKAWLEKRFPGHNIDPKVREKCLSVILEMLTPCVCQQAEE